MRALLLLLLFPGMIFGQGFRVNSLGQTVDYDGAVVISFNHQPVTKQTVLYVGPYTRVRTYTPVRVHTPTYVPARTYAPTPVRTLVVPPARAILAPPVKAMNSLLNCVGNT